jgi:hypothetical protein
MLEAISCCIICIARVECEAQEVALVETAEFHDASSCEPTFHSAVAGGMLLGEAYSGDKDAGCAPQNVKAEEHT